MNDMLCLLCSEAAHVCAADKPQETFCGKVCARVHYALVDNEAKRKREEDNTEARFEYFSQIPADVQRIILTKLSPQQLWSACTTNRAMAAICRSEAFKREYIRADTKRMTEFIRDALLRNTRVNQAKLSEWLMLAIQEGAWEPSAEDNSAIHWAAENGYVDVVQFLMKEKHVDPTTHNNYAIRVAAANGHADVVRLLLTDKNVMPTAKDNYAITEAARNGHTEVVRVLLNDRRKDGRKDLRANPRDNRSYSLLFAVQKGHADIVRLLLADGRANPKNDHSSTILIASGRGYEEVVHLLLEDGRADPSDNGSESIRVAAKNGHYQVVYELLEDGRADPNAKDWYYRKNAIEYAAENGHSKIVQLMLQYPRVKDFLSPEDRAKYSQI